MGLSHSLSSNRFFSFFLSLILFICPSHSSDYTAFVLKGCADQNFPNPKPVYRQNLDSLYTSLKSQSSVSKFFKSTVGGESQTSITGLFQCRGDLSNTDCNNCVGKLPDLSTKLCGGDAIAVRIQLTGCYLRYEVAGFRQVSGIELLYKICKPEESINPNLSTALEQILTGITSAGNGFYAGRYESTFVLGQCEGDLGNSDCIECVKAAVEKTKIECANSISAQIYLQMCYISYTYYPNGVVSSRSQSGTTHNAQKTIAIVFGCSVLFGLAVACLLFIRSTLKKDRYYNKY